MATVTSKVGFQSQAITDILLAINEHAIISFDATIGGRVKWDMGGVSWTIAPRDTGDAMNVTVEHSLTRDGDDWVADPDSPFSSPAQGVENHRIERIRFTSSGTDPVRVVVASPAPFNVATG